MSAKVSEIICACGVGPWSFDGSGVDFAASWMYWWRLGSRDPENLCGFIRCDGCIVDTEGNVRNDCCSAPLGAAPEAVAVFAAFVRLLFVCECWPRWRQRLLPSTTTRSHSVASRSRARASNAAYPRRQARSGAARSIDRATTARFSEERSTQFEDIGRRAISQRARTPLLAITAVHATRSAPTSSITAMHARVEQGNSTWQVQLLWSRTVAEVTDYNSAPTHEIG